ncbi:MAG: hypothetical protein E7294_03565 [Lachnospiraceae bacterium]|nr:hypothetical protein [Lachnospiraceae bacterium]
MKRDQTFQILTVIGILSVIMGHVDLDTFPLMNTWFTPYSYHMALFVFISGYFYKEQNAKSGENAVRYTCKKIRTLLFPLFVWNLLYGGLVALLSHRGFQIGQMPTPYNLLIAPFLDGPVFVYNMTGWFVMPLFLVQMLFVWGGLLLRRFLMQRSGQKDPGETDQRTGSWITGGLFILLFAAGMFGVHLAITEQRLVWQLLYTRTSFFAVFFFLGHIYRKNLEKWDKLPHLAYFGIVLFFQFCILYFAKGRLDYVIGGGEQFENGVLLPFVTAVTGIAFYLRLARILAAAVPQSKAVDLVCHHSYSIMMHQFAGFMAVKGMIGLLQKVFHVFADFSIDVMKVNIWYYYFPHNTAAFGVWYILGGLLVPVTIGIVSEKICACVRRLKPGKHG